MENSNQQPSTDQQTQQPVVLPSNPRKSKTSFFILTIFIFLIFISGIGYFLKNSNVKNQNSNPPASQQGEQLKSKNLTPTQTAIISPTPTPDETVNWKTYTDSKYNYSIQYPDDWVLTQGKDYEGDPQVIIRNKNSEKARFSTTRQLPEIYIGLGVAYSTSGTVCANQSCDEIKNESVNIDGKTYTFPIIKGAVKNIFDFYAFTFYINHKKFNLSNYSTQIGLTIYSSYKTEAEEKTINQILSTFKFTN